MSEALLIDEMAALNARPVPVAIAALSVLLRGQLARVPEADRRRYATALCERLVDDVMRDSATA